MENKSSYLGISGVVSHDKKDVEEYNKLLNLMGAEGMLIQFERWVDAEQLSEIIQFTKDNLQECGIDFETKEEK